MAVQGNSLAMNHDSERQINEVCAMAQLRITLADIL